MLNVYGDVHTYTAPHCCELCGRPNIVEKKGVKVDGKIVSFNEKSVTVTHREMQLCELLVRYFGQTVHREVIWNTIWGAESTASPAMLNVLFCKIRKKIRPLGLDIANSWGVGFSMVFF